MDTELIIILLIVLGVISVLLIGFLVFMRVRSRKRQSDDFTNRRSKEDIYLNKGNEYIVASNSPFLPGKYMILTDGDRSKHVNIRVTGFIKEFKVKKTLILEENDKITALSENIILKPIKKESN